MGEDYYIEYQKRLTLKEMIDVIINRELRKEFDYSALDRSIVPAGGLLVMKNRRDDKYFKVLVIAEIKRQGTNERS